VRTSFLARRPRPIAKTVARGPRDVKTTHFEQAFWNPEPAGLCQRSAMEAASRKVAAGRISMAIRAGR
jgi:hypothetical protein